MDIDVDSNNNGVIQTNDATEDNIELQSPGFVLGINWNDGNNNGTQDRNDPGPLNQPDQDLEPAALNWTSGGANPAGYKLKLSTSNNRVKLWRTQEKLALPVPAEFFVGDPNPSLNPPSQVYLEGVDFGATIVTWELFDQAGVLLASDQVRVTVTAAELTGHRPQTEGPGYGLPFPKTRVPDSAEVQPGVGIRRNLDTDAAGLENDLIEVMAGDVPAGAYAGGLPQLTGIEYVLKRSNTKINVWSGAQKTGQIQFNANNEVVMTSVPATLWVEWVAAKPPAGQAETSDVTVITRTTSTSYPKVDVFNDVNSFYPFNGIVIAFGGRGAVPLDPDSGPFQMAQTLYEAGYDVHAYNENAMDVYYSSNQQNPLSAPWAEVKAAIDVRGVDSVAIFGHSWGGGATYLLAKELGVGPPQATWTLAFTAYIDSIEYGFGGSETRRPLGSMYHVNYFQRHFGLRGDNTIGLSWNVNVNLTAWGAALGHTTIDNDATVRTRILQGFSGPVDLNHSGLTGLTNR